MSLKSLFIFLLLFSATVQASNWKSYFLNRQALQELKNENYGSSLRHILAALEVDPLNPKIHLNLGLSLIALEEPLKAAQAFMASAELADNPQDKFVALFNAGYSFGEAKNIESALSAYQQALTLDPHSIEVKTNIELLLNQQSQQGQGGESEGSPDQKPSEGGANQKQGDKQDEKKDKNQGENSQEPKQPQSKPKSQDFKSKELTASDVKKILEELKSQEQGIRAKEYEKGLKERPTGKDW